MKNIKQELLDSLQPETVIVLPFLRNYDEGSEGVTTYNKVRQVWNSDGEISARYSYVMQGHEVEITFRDGNGRQCLSFYTVTENKQAVHRAVLAHIVGTTARKVQSAQEILC